MLASKAGPKSKLSMKDVLLWSQGAPPPPGPRRIGIHTSTAGGVEMAAERAYRLGANGINSLQFSASNTDSARRSALADALASARGDAEALARAAGGTLGPMIEASTSSAVMPRPVMGMTMRMSAEPAPTPISPGEQTLYVNVTTRWRFTPGSK